MAASLRETLFSDELFRQGQALDVSKYYVILPDSIGHGKSSRPSDGLRARFHLRLVMGTSMGAMHAWLWGEKYPDFMDALFPLASLPTQISGRNRMWRKTVSEAIRTDPEWDNGNYQKQPRSLRLAAQMLFLMSSNPVIRQKQGPTLKEADEYFEKTVGATLATIGRK